MAELKQVIEKFKIDEATFNEKSADEVYSAILEAVKPTIQNEKEFVAKIRNEGISSARSEIKAGVIDKFGDILPDDVKEKSAIEIIKHVKAAHEQEKATYEARLKEGQPGVEKIINEHKNETLAAKKDAEKLKEQAAKEIADKDREIADLRQSINFRDYRDKVKDAVLAQGDTVIGKPSAIADILTRDLMKEFDLADDGVILSKETKTRVTKKNSTEEVHINDVTKERLEGYEWLKKSNGDKTPSGETPPSATQTQRTTQFRGSAFADRNRQARQSIG